MAGTRKRTFGPVAMSNVLTTNIYNQGSALIYDVIDHITIVNKTGVPVSFSMFLGASGANAAGTEVIGNGKVIAANDTFNWYGRLKMTSADFLVGGASAAASLTITAEGEQNVV
jgi:hypothetical protein